MTGVQTCALPICHHWRATNGRQGTSARCTGASGEDLRLHVPPGTIIRDRDHGITLADLDEPGREITICEGGRGGNGNYHFKSSTNQTPREYEEGTEGGERNLTLELKLMADVGLCGLPNAGKSTFLSVVSNAAPKIGSYPFTTLVPSLGMVDLDLERTMTIADIPGLIEGAADGQGLGHEFLKHIERCRVVLHLVDLYPPDLSDPIENYRQIRRELERFSPDLAAKPEVIGANKIDLGIEEDDTLELFTAEVAPSPVYPISGATREGLKPLLEALWRSVHPEPE